MYLQTKAMPFREKERKRYNIPLIKTKAQKGKKPAKKKPAEYAGQN
jgi:hypothetical protein